MTHIIGHRGIPVKEPENTLSSFKKALEAGVYAIEFDVRRSLDGELMVFHDEHSSRVTNYDVPLSAFTREELQKVQVLESEETIPTFSETIDYLFSSNRCPMPDEVRVESKERGLAEDMIEIIEEYDCIEDTVIQSFNPADLYEVYRVSDGAARTALLSANPERRLLNVAESVGCEIISIPYTDQAEQYLDQAEERGFKTDLWVDSTRDAIEKGLRLEPDYLGTDDPLTAIKSNQYMKEEI